MTIGDDSFAGCKGIQSLTLPEGITTIGDSAFGGKCKGEMGLGVNTRTRMQVQMRLREASMTVEM